MRGAILLALFFCALLSRGEVWYVPGWLKCHVPESSTMEAVRSCFPGETTVYCDWDGDRLWGTSVTNAEKQVERLVAEIVGLDASTRTNLTLVGHSLGGRIVVRTLARLGRKGLVVRRGIVLAAAMPRDDADLVRCGIASREPVLVLSNPGDVTLRCLYRMAPGVHDAALGLDGPGGKSFNVRSVVVPPGTTDATDIKAFWGRVDFFKKVAAHHALFYLEHLKKTLQEEH